MRHAIVCPTIKVFIAVTLIAIWAAPAGAVDRVWNQLSGTQAFNSAANWTPGAIPVAADNLTFGLNGDVDVFLGAPSVGSNITISDGIVNFLNVGGSVLNNGGVATIDDPSAAGLVDGTFATLDSARWDSAGDARIGSAGAGTMTVQNGGDFEADQFFIGDGAIAKGEVTVTGTGSTLNASLNSNVSLYSIGINGGTGTLHVLAGADITTTSTTQGDISIGEGAGSVGTLNIDGADSTAESEDIWVGHGGTGFLNITNGGAINLTDTTAANRNVEVGRTLVATGAIGAGTVVVSGDNSLLGIGTLTVGTTGAGTATVSAGGRIATGSDSSIGNVAGSSGALTVTGVGSMADSTFAVTGNLLVGVFGQGTLRAELGGNITVSTDLRIGEDITNANDNSVTVTGGGSLLTVLNRLVVGNEGVGNNTPGSETTNALSITSGADATAAFLRVAEFAGSKGEMLVNGAGTNFNATADAVIGTAGTGGLEVSGGAVLTTTSSFFAGYSGAGNGTVIVSGAGSQVEFNSNDASDVFIGGYTASAGGTGSVTIENGGRMFTRRNVFIGGNATGNGSLTITGPDSLLIAFDSGANEATYVGYANQGTLTIADGASALSKLVRIGELTTVGVGEAAATVTGTNGTASNWNVDQTIIVGNGGVGALSVTAGGKLNSNAGVVLTNSGMGFGASSDGSSAVIDGPGSKWTDAHGLVGPGTDFYVGNSGGSVALPITLTVQNGGALETGRGVIARLDGSQADVVVTGNGSRWDATSILVGNLGNGSLTVSDQADVQATGGIIVGVSVNAAQRGIGVATVTGAGSTLSTFSPFPTNNTLTIGNANMTVGTLNVQDGGAVTNTGNGLIAALAGSTGTVNVGNGSATISTWTNAASLFVGGGSAAAGGAGTLNINDRGSVSVANQLKLWANGHAVLNGGTAGTLQLTTLTRVAGSTFDFQSGKLSFLNNAGNNRVFDAAALADIFNANPTINAGQTLQVLGPVTLSAPLRLNGGTLSVASVKPGSETAFASNLDFDAGTLQLTGQGLIISPAGPLGDTVSLVPGQTLAVSGGGLTNVGSLNVIGAAASFTGAASTNDVGAEINAINATLDFTPGLTNNGVMNLINTTIAGSVNSAAGSAASYVGDNSVDGDLTMAPDDLLQIRIGGTGAGQYDTLAVSGAATLDGTLAVSLTGGFMPMLGDQFGVVSFAAHTGGFDTYTGLALGGHLALKPTLTASSLLLKSLPAIDGDINLDGTVNIFDVNSVSLNWGTTGPQGDANGDGTVNIFDVNLISFNWGATGAADVTVVPEPATWLMAVIGLMVMATARRRD